MLICFSDCIYFNYGLRYSIIKSNYFGNEINKVINYSNDVKINDFPKFLRSTNYLGNYLDYVLINYSQRNFEVFQFVLLLKTFCPLIKVFVSIKEGFVFTEFEKSLLFILNAEIFYNFPDFCDLIRIRNNRSANSPCETLLRAIPSNFHISRKDALFISLIISGLSPRQISSVLNININKVYYYRNKIHAKFIIKNDVDLICRVQLLTIKFYNETINNEISILR
ncbi:TPA: helix-turn-helix transcriptional regulator [Klebsiella pneumoniae]|nr:helix-turn-helix transcriptional regulator [Klebsiella pneumoniae]